MRDQTLTACPGTGRRGRRAFSLAELLVVMGVISLLLAMTVPTLHLAREQARSLRCATNQQQLALALEACATTYDGFYPLWDDGDGPTRHTWIDVLVQLQLFGSHEAGYCPADRRPDAMNEARASFHGVYYPGAGADAGVDYSYGIGVPLSAGGWRWQPRFAPPGDSRGRVFWNYLQSPAQRVLAADASWSYIYNLSGDYLLHGTWNNPTQYDNTVAWLRHPHLSANILFQDGHVATVRYDLAAERRGDSVGPVDTARHFLWYPGEPKNVGPDYPDPFREGNWYPNSPPVRVVGDSFEGEFPNDLNPSYYTALQHWTEIQHK